MKTIIKNENYEKQTKDALNSIIGELNLNKDNYVKNPGVDFQRNRKMNFETTINFILSMSGGSINKELYKFFGNEDPDKIVSRPGFIQQRHKLKDNLFEELFYKFNDTMTDYKTYKGYRLMAVDGSDINIAKNEESDTYIPIKDKEDGYNQIHLNAIYDLLNKVYVNVNLQPRPTADERKAFVDMLKSQEYASKTLFIADRGYPSYNIFAHFKYINNADYLIRVKNSEMNIIKELPMVELDVDRQLIVSTHTKYKKYPVKGYAYIQIKKNKMQNRDYIGNTSFKTWDHGEEEQLNFRIVRFKLNTGDYETIITSLPREQFPLEEIKKLYAMRWGIETSFRELKYIMGLTNLHAKREDFVIQEIYAKLTMYNFAERIISHCVIEQDENRKHTYQVNYTMAMQICLDFFKSLYDIKVYELMKKYILPVIPGRQDKRKKIKTKSFVSFTYRVAA